MTEAQARTTANVVLATAVIGAAYYVLKTPSLRRKAWQMARAWAAGPLAVWVATEVRRAWDESASARLTPSAVYGATGSASAATGVASARTGSPVYDGEARPAPNRLRAGG